MKNWIWIPTTFVDNLKTILTEPVPKGQIVRRLQRFAFMKWLATGKSSINDVIKVKIPSPSPEPSLKLFSGKISENLGFLLTASGENLWKTAGTE